VISKPWLILAFVDYYFDDFKYTTILNVKNITNLIYKLNYYSKKMKLLSFIEGGRVCVCKVVIIAKLDYKITLNNMSD
jgi:hypothetical protein